MAQPPANESDLQAAVDAFARLNNKTYAAEELGISRSTLLSRLEQAKRRGINTTEEKLETLHGWNPEHDLNHTIPSPLVVSGVSTLYKDGEAKLQWVKSKLSDQLRDEAIKAAIQELAKEVIRAEPLPPPTHSIENLCNLYTLTDCHVGAYAWAKEAGADWDLTIAETTLTRSMDYLIEATPPAQIGIISQLGDFLHYDSLSAITPLHGHLLDADSRFSKMVKVAIRILRYVIDLALKKHSQVIVLMAEGNHDLASSVWLRHLFSLLYENEPRVQVIDSELPYYIYLHGETMLAFHHGHLRKNSQLPLLFAAQFPSEWGQAKKRYAHTGHMHHVDIKEHSGMIVTQHPTIAARDAYAARGGWIADRQITAITYHKNYGQVNTITVCPEMLET